MGHVQIDHDIIYSKAGNKIAYAIMYVKVHIYVKGYSMFLGAGSTVACPESVDTPSTNYNVHR